jgi:SAM-dependent methyltransferase
MARRIRMKQGVVWYPLDESLWLIVSPSSDAPEKCRLMNREDVALLDFFKNAPSVHEEKIPPHAMTVVDRWLSPEFPILEESKDPRPLKDYEQLALAVFQEYRSAKDLEGYHDLSTYHQEKIQNPFRQFDKIETTVNHLYREGHPALGDKSYGARFAQMLVHEGSLPKGAYILEVGCGTGLFGRAFLSEARSTAPALYETLRYTFFDLSPTLMDSQREINKEHREVVSFIQGDASAHAFEQAAYDIVICNEMIADLPVIKLNRDRRKRRGPEGEAWNLLRRLRLDVADAPPQFVLNIGALLFLVNLSHTLRPNGMAYIVEYGSPYAYARGQLITDHMEYSVHFGHLLRGAHALGLEGTLNSLTEFLHFDPELRVLDSLCHSALFNYLLPFLNIEAEAGRVYTKSLLNECLPKVVPKVENLSFVPLRSLKGIAYPEGFYVLKLLNKKR